MKKICIIFLLCISYLDSKASSSSSSSSAQNNASLLTAQQKKDTATSSPSNSSSNSSYSNGSNPTVQNAFDSQKQKMEIVKDIFAAIELNDHNTLTSLLKQIDDINDSNIFSIPALHNACIRGSSPSIIKALIDAGADVKRKNKDNKTALANKTALECLSMCTKWHEKNRVSDLIRVADLLIKANPHFDLENLMFIAICYVNDPLTEHMINTCPDKINVQFVEKLIIKVNNLEKSQGVSKMQQILLKLLTKLSSSSSSATSTDKLLELDEYQRKLLASTNNLINAISHSLSDTLRKCAIDSDTIGSDTEEEDTEKILHLDAAPTLPKSTAKKEYNAQTFSSGNLILACKNRDEKAIDELLQNNAMTHVYQQDEYGNTPLHYCIMGNRSQPIMPLVQKLLVKQTVLDIKNKRGITPLCTALLNGYLECADLLLKHGAKLQEVDFNYVLKNGSPDSVLWLLKKDYLYKAHQSQESYVIRIIDELCTHPTDPHERIIKITILLLDHLYENFTIEKHGIRILKKSIITKLNKKHITRLKTTDDELTLPMFVACLPYEHQELMEHLLKQDHHAKAMHQKNRFNNTAITYAAKNKYKALSILCSEYIAAQSNNKASKEEKEKNEHDVLPKHTKTEQTHKERKPRTAHLERRAQLKAAAQAALAAQAANTITASPAPGNATQEPSLAIETTQLQSEHDTNGYTADPQQTSSVTTDHGYSEEEMKKIAQGKKLEKDAIKELKALKKLCNAPDFVNNGPSMIHKIQQCTEVLKKHEKVDNAEVQKLIQEVKQLKKAIQAKMHALNNSTHQTQKNDKEITHNKEVNGKEIKEKIALLEESFDALRNTIRDSSKQLSDRQKALDKLSRESSSLTHLYDTIGQKPNLRRNYPIVAYQNQLNEIQQKAQQKLTHDKALNAIAKVSSAAPSSINLDAAASLTQSASSSNSSTGQAIDCMNAQNSLQNDRNNGVAVTSTSSSTATFNMSHPSASSSSAQQAVNGHNHNTSMVQALWQRPLQLDLPRRTFTPLYDLRHIANAHMWSYGPLVTPTSSRTAAS